MKIIKTQHCQEGIKIEVQEGFNVKKIRDDLKTVKENFQKRMTSKRIKTNMIPSQGTQDGNKMTVEDPNTTSPNLKSHHTQDHIKKDMKSTDHNQDPSTAIETT